MIISRHDQSPADEREESLVESKPLIITPLSLGSRHALRYIPVPTARLEGELK